MQMARGQPARATSTTPPLQAPLLHDRHHRLPGAQDPHDEPGAAQRHPCGGARGPHPRRGQRRRPGWLGPVPAGPTFCRSGADARPGRRPQPPDGRHLVALYLRWLLRRHRSGRPGVAGPEDAGRGGGRTVGGRCRHGRRVRCQRRRTGGGLGVRPDLLRRAPLPPRRPRPCQHHPAGGRDACQRPHPQRQHRGAEPGRPAAQRHRPPGHPAGRRRPAHR